MTHQENEVSCRKFGWSTWSNRVNTMMKLKIQSVGLLARDEVRQALLVQRQGLDLATANGKTFSLVTPN